MAEADRTIAPAAINLIITHEPHSSWGCITVVAGAEGVVAGTGSVVAGATAVVPGSSLVVVVVSGGLPIVVVLVVAVAGELVVVEVVVAVVVAGASIWPSTTVITTALESE